MRSGERRRGTGRAMGVGVWEGIFFGCGSEDGVCEELVKAEGRVSRTFCRGMDRRGCSPTGVTDGDAGLLR